MKNSRLNRWLVFACVLALALVSSACDDDGTNNIGNVDITTISTKDCYEPSNDNERFDTVALNWDGQTLTVNHTGSCRNCGFDMRVYAVARGSLLTIKEWSWEGDPVAACSCMFDYAYQLEGIEPGAYDLTFYYEDYERGPFLKFERPDIPLRETPWEDVLTGRDTSQCY